MDRELNTESMNCYIDSFGNIVVECQTPKQLYDVQDVIVKWNSNYRVFSDDIDVIEE